VKIFQGVPDILIHKSKQITTIVSHDEDSGDGREMRPPLKGSFQKMPEKLGELIASLYIMLVCKIIRKLKKKRLVNVKGSY